MKRFKDCSLLCKSDQEPILLLDVVERISAEKGYKVERYSALTEKDTLAVYMRKKGLPISRLIVSINHDRNEVSIINIVPLEESGVSEIGCIDYNALLDLYCHHVFDEIKNRYGNVITETSEDYTISDIIPSSFPSLEIWLSNYPLSGHPYDEERWMDFVIALHSNNEYISLDDFGKYIQEKYGWDEETIGEFYEKLEFQLEILKYYDSHR